MRTVDRFLGIPLCWLVGFLTRISRISDSEATGKPVRNILVIKFFGMGSIILGTPALALMKHNFPDARITFLTFRKNRELLERLSAVDRVLTIDPTSGFTFLRDAVNVIRSISSIHPDVTFDFEFFSKFSTLLSGLSRAPIRVAFELPTYWRSSIVTHRVPLDKRNHVLHSFCEQVFCLSSRRTQIPCIAAPIVSKDDHASLHRKVSIDGKRTIAINVNAGDTFLERRWPGNRFAQLVNALAGDDEAAVFCFIGNDEESEYVQNVIRQTACVERCMNTSGRLTIPDLAALLQRSELLISNDSGPVHLAAALGIPIVALYGPESPDFYGIVQGESTVIYKNISCSPCMNVYSAKQFRCPFQARCMTEISVSQVLECVRSTVLVN